MHLGLNAQLLSRQAGYRSAGIHGYILNLLQHLPQVIPSDWQMTAWVSKDTPYSFDGVELRAAGWRTDSPMRRIAWEQLRQPFLLGEYDLYHAMAFVAPLWLPVPMVVTVYDLSFLRFPQALSPARRLYLRAFTRLTCQRARRVLAISQSTATDVHELLGIPKEKIDVTLLGYDMETYYPYSNDEIAAFCLQQGLPERYALFVGTLEPRKNLLTLLRAYQQIPSSDRIPLVIGGGKGWQYDDMFAFVEQHQLGESVFFPGFIPTDELPLWYNGADVFVFPSVFEGFGLPVLEAMACGTPVLVSDTSSLPEVAGDAGMCLPAKDIDAWREALVIAFQDSAWREQATSQGLARSRQFTWTKTAEATLASYRQAMV